MTKRQRIERLSHIGKGLQCVREILVHFDCTSLKSLNLHANRLESFEGLQYLTALLELNLSSNRLLTVCGFPKLSALESLNLASNGLSSLNGIPVLPSLKSLNLAHNRISSLQGLEVFNEGSLCSLDLSGNLLESVEVFNTLTDVKTLRDLSVTRYTGSGDSKATESDTGLQACIAELLPQLEVLDGEKAHRYIMRKVHPPASSNSIQPSNFLKQIPPTGAPGKDFHVVQYVPGSVYNRPTPQKISIGYPVCSHAPENPEAGRLSMTIRSSEYTERVNVGTDPISKGETQQKGVQASHDDFAPKKAVASVQVELESSETQKLRQDLERLESELKQAKGTLRISASARRPNHGFR